MVKLMLENDVTPKAILSWIKSTGEAAERDAIVEAAAYGNGRASVDDKKHLGEQYYETRYGKLNH